jgi:hypothetical protein
MRAALGPPSLKGAALTALDSALMAAATPSGTTTPKTINLIFAAASGSSPNSATPAYVTGTGWAGSSPPVDVCYCTNYEGNSGYSNLGSNCYNTNHTLFDSSGVPASWEFPFYNAYYQFAQLLSTYYSELSPSGSAITPYIGYIRFGLLTGGGTVVACPAPAMTLNASMFGGESFGTNGVVPIQWADDIARIAIANGFGITAESLQSADLTDYAAALPCSNDWCNLFNLYYPFAPILGLQTVDVSNPSCMTSCASSLTGSLVTVLPFGTQHHARVFEIKYVDLLCAYDQNSYSSTNCPNPPDAPYAPYAAALANTAAGQPPSTSALSGAAGLAGSAAIR